LLRLSGFARIERHGDCYPHLGAWVHSRLGPNAGSQQSMRTNGIFIGQIVVFVVFNSFLALASLIIVHRFGKRQLSWSELVVGALLFFASLIAGCAISLGALGRLTYESLIVSTTLVVICLLILFRRTGPLALPAGNPAHWFLKLRAQAGIFPLALLFVVGIALIAELYVGLAQPPLNGDDLGYHLPFAVTWLQTGNLSATRAPFWFYPGTSELFVFWLLAPFRNDLFIGLQNWPFLMLALVSIYALARRAGLTTAWGIYAALFFLGIRALHFQLTSQNNDVVLAALFLGGTSMLMVYDRTRAVGSLVLTGLAMGLIIGVKYNGFSYAALLMLAYVLLVARRQRLRLTLRHLLLMAVIAGLLGGFWYVRNWSIAGNPFAPLRIQFAGTILFPGQELFMGNRVQDTTLLGHIRDGEALQLFWAALERNGLLTSLALTGIALAGLLWGAGFLSPRWPAPRHETGLCIFLSLGSIVLLAVTPLLVENVPHTLNQLRDAYSPIRYGFVTWGLASVLLAWLLACVDRMPVTLAMKALVALIVLTPFVAALTRMVDLLGSFATLDGASTIRFGLLLCLTLFAVSVVEVRWRRSAANEPRDVEAVTMASTVPTGDFARRMPLRNLIAWGCAALMVLLTIIGVSVFVKNNRMVRRDRVYAGFFDAQYPAAFQQIAARGSQTLAVIGWQVPYFWYGPDFRNPVFLCPQNSSAALVNCMAHNHVDTLVTVRNPFGGAPVPTDDPRLTLMQGRLNQVYRDPSIGIYEVAGPITPTP
jgi:hypothetical protein